MLADVGREDLTMGTVAGDLTINDRTRRVFLLREITFAVVFKSEAGTARITQALGPGVETVREVLRGIINEVIRIVVLVETVRDLQQVFAAGARRTVVVELLQTRTVVTKLAVFEVQETQALVGVGVVEHPRLSRKVRC